jgi:hypothetical protein
LVSRASGELSEGGKPAMNRAVSFTLTSCAAAEQCTLQC